MRGASRRSRPGSRGKAVLALEGGTPGTGREAELARQGAGGGSGGASRREQGQAGGAEASDPLELREHHGCVSGSQECPCSPETVPSCQ